MANNLWQIKLKLHTNTDELKKTFDFGYFDLPEIRRSDRLKRKTSTNAEKSENMEQPLPYIKLKKNKALRPIKLAKRKLSHVQSCFCEEFTCSNDDCLNRMRRIECNSKNCKFTVAICENRRFQKYFYPKLMAKKLAHKGWGLIASENIAKGEFIIEYVGEMINKRECDRRIQIKEKNNDDNYYVVPAGDIYIDSNRKGNDARFINHSCKPNCEIQYWTVQENICVGIFALHDIQQVKLIKFFFRLFII